MNVRDWLLFISTLLMGMLCGMYLYYTTFVPAYLTNPVVTDLTTQLQPDWTIGVRVYGGCERSGMCPAFSLDSKGRYQYQPDPATAITDGRVPDSLVRGYESTLETNQVRSWAQSASVAGCAGQTDRLEYRLQVTLGAERYDLNTCGTNLERDSSLVVLVRETLSYLDNPAQYQAGDNRQSAGIASYLERWLDENFSYDDAE